MSMVLARSPLEPIGMNGAGTQKRRSTRLSHEGAEGDEPPAKKPRMNGAQTTSTTVSTKEQDGDASAMGKRKRPVYDEEVEGFAYKKGSRSRRSKETKQPAVRNSTSQQQTPPREPPVPPAPESSRNGVSVPTPAPAPIVTAADSHVVKKTRRRFPTTPEREAAEKPVRRSKRLSSEHAPADPQPSPQRPAHAKSHANTERSPSPDRARPVTVEKKRKRGPHGMEEEQKTMRIQLPFQDTPVIRRNKDMRKTLLDGHSRRSSSGMRGRRASSLIDEGRGNGECTVSASPTFPPESTPSCAKPSGQSDSPNSRTQAYDELEGIAQGSPTPPPNDPDRTGCNVFKRDLRPIARSQEFFTDDLFSGIALPHAEVPTAEFFKHISADLTEPRRMRCLLGWCGTRALPPKPEAPKDGSQASMLEHQALESAHVIEKELSQALSTNGTLSDWFSRDEAVVPQIPLTKKPNPRNITNLAKAEELEKELERLKRERAEWEKLIDSATVQDASAGAGAETDRALSPLHADLLDSPQRAIFAQLQAADDAPVTDPHTIGQRLHAVSENLEFSIDQFAHGVHALTTVRETAERLADRALADAAMVLKERDKHRAANGVHVDGMDALKALGKVLNAQPR